MAFRNLAREYTTTTGTSNCVLSGAVPGCNTWENAGVANGEVVRYGIITYDTSTHRATHSEVGLGTYTTADNTLARTTVESSTNSGSKITLTGLSEVYICPTALDLNNGTNLWASYYRSGAATAVNTGASGFIAIDTEWADPASIATLASDTVTVTYSGYYDIDLRVRIFAAADIGNGRIKIEITDSPEYLVSNTVGFHTTFGIQEADLYARGIVPLPAGATIQVKVYNDSVVKIKAS
jgi:hypothetical protein